MTTVATSIKLTARRARGDMASSQEAAFSLTPAIMSSALCAAKSRPGPGGLSVRRNRPRVDLDSILRRRQGSDVDQGRGPPVSVQPSHRPHAATAGVHVAHQVPSQFDEIGHRHARCVEVVAHVLQGDLALRDRVFGHLAVTGPADLARHDQPARSAADFDLMAVGAEGRMNRLRVARGPAHKSVGPITLTRLELAAFSFASVVTRLHLSGRRGKRESQPLHLACARPRRSFATTPGAAIRPRARAEPGPPRRSFAVSRSSLPLAGQNGSSGAPFRGRAWYAGLPLER